MGWIERFWNARERAQRRDAYTAYLRSDAWQQVRTAALRRAQGRCEWWSRSGRRCAATTGLQCHHLHYDTFGNERLRDVLMLCAKHHAIADKQRERERDKKRPTRR